jgi:hypothetical protein
VARVKSALVTPTEAQGSAQKINNTPYMTGIELLIGTSAIAGKAAIKKAIGSIFDAANEKLKASLRAHKNNVELTKLYQQLAKIRKVKTLGQLDKAVDLTSFYCDSHVFIENKRILVRGIEDFACSGSILIEGIAGQGKSIFLRYLCSVETIKGKCVPIFAELRRVQQGQTLVDFLIKTLRCYHIDVDEVTLSDLANSGKLVLMLDAFDEVREDSKERILHELEAFGAEHESLQILITSRPDSGLAACPHLQVVRLSDLKGDEYTKVIYKVTDDGELAEQLIKQVKTHKGGIKDLLLTPLMVTLLVIRYKSFQELPQQLSDFYDSLFQLLLQRHDGLKPGYTRSRRCRMNDRQYREAFEAFCFIAKRYRNNQLTYAEAYDASDSALKDRSLTEDAEAFVTDIVKVTCLLVKDGEEFRFIHKSVQEFYVASYIAGKADVAAEKLYARLFAKDQCWNFSQELRFLAEIDRHRYFKFGVLPFLSAFFSINADEFLHPPKATHIAVVQNQIAACDAHCYEFGGALEVHGYRLPSFGPFTMIANHLLEKPVFSILTSSMRSAPSRPEKPNLIPISELLSRFPSIDLPKGAALVCEMLFLEARKALVSVQKEESFASVLSFIDEVGQRPKKLRSTRA